MAYARDVIHLLSHFEDFHDTLRKQQLRSEFV